MRTLVAASLLLVTAATAAAQKPLQRPPDAQRAPAPASAYVPDLPALAATRSELRDVIDRFDEDRSALRRFHSTPGPQTRARLRDFYQAWLTQLPTLRFEQLSQDGKVDYVLLRTQLEYQLALLEREARNERRTDALVPFADAVSGLQNDRQLLRFVSADSALSALARIGTQLDAAVRSADQRVAGADPLTLRLAAERVAALRGTLAQWFDFYDGYDPTYTERVAPAHARIASTLSSYANTIRRAAGMPELGGGRGGRGGPPAGGSLADGPIIGQPIGRDGILEDLSGEMIVYTPEQLIAIGEIEYAWCVEEMKKASRELGFGDDWMRALEHVKNQYVPRGEQPVLIRNLALEAERYLRERDLVTVPPLAADVWRMQMMSPERQRVNPFFTGGETISVSYPHVSMSEGDAMMSMRGNGIHVSRATVHHELIPGHHLQAFMYARYNPHRTVFNTPFNREGGALYWEMLLWDMGFPRSPEDRIGMLWWRMHRAARIIFSLNYHLGRWTPEQAIDFLVDNVGHERFTATGEVRRSFEGNYSPLYQVAYMMGGLQLMALRREVVGPGRMTDRQFHDAVLRAGVMPIEALRALLTNQQLSPSHRAQWKYYGDVTPSTGGRP